MPVPPAQPQPPQQQGSIGIPTSPAPAAAARLPVASQPLQANAAYRAAPIPAGPLPVSYAAELTAQNADMPDVLPLP